MRFNCDFNGPTNLPLTVCVAHVGSYSLQKFALCEICNNCSNIGHATRSCIKNFVSAKQAFDTILCSVSNVTTVVTNLTKDKFHEICKKCSNIAHASRDCIKSLVALSKHLIHLLVA